MPFVPVTVNVMSEPTPITPTIVLDWPTESRSRRKYPGYYSRRDTARLLKRAKSTLNRWDCLLLQANEDYKKLSLGSRKPWHPYQVELLVKISHYQFRNQNPRLNRDEEEILNFVSEHEDIWTEENWVENNYQLPNHDNNHRAS